MRPHRPNPAPPGATLKERKAAHVPQETHAERKARLRREALERGAPIDLFGLSGQVSTFLDALYRARGVVTLPNGRKVGAADLRRRLEDLGVL